MIAFPPGQLFNEHWIEIGDHTLDRPARVDVGGHVERGPRPRPRRRSSASATAATSVGAARWSAGSASTIGDDVTIAPDLYVTDHNHAYDDVDVPIARQWPHEPPVSIGSGSWIGAGVVILPGTTIGEHVTVAAGSVVRGDIPDRSVVAGVPGRVVRRCVDGAGTRRLARARRRDPRRLADPLMRSGLMGVTTTGADGLRPVESSVASRSSTGARPPCAWSTPPASSTATSPPSRSTPAPSAGRCSCARPTRRCASTTSASRWPARPTSTSTVLAAALTAAPCRGGVGRVGLRGRAARVRRAVRRSSASRSSARPADVMRRLGDKIGAKRLAEEADVPAGARGAAAPVETVDEALAAGQPRSAIPLMVKAAAGGGGRGIRRVDHEPRPRRRRSSAPGARGAKSFGDPTVFLERVVTDARHVEVQIIADHHGTVWAPGVRDCSHPAPQPEGHRGVALHRARARSRSSACATPPSGWPRRRATPTPAPSSSSTSPTRTCSPSSRSTPGCRSSTRSPR